MPLVDASIVAVTVYSDRARVTRRGQIALEPGEHTLTVENLPITLDEDSVRASGKGAGVVIRGVDVKTEYLDDPLEFDRSGLEERMEALKDEDNELRDALVLQDSTLTFLNNLSERTSASLARSLSRDKASLDDVTAINQYLAEQRTSVQEQQRDIRKKR